MSVLRATGLSKSYGTNTLFENGSVIVNRSECAALVGTNGSGKSTLLRCLLGLEELDAGHVSFGCSTVGYVEQRVELKGPTVYDDWLDAFSDVQDLAAKKAALERSLGADASAEELQEYGKIVARFEHLQGYGYEAAICRVAFGLGFSKADFTVASNALSGGQKARVLLAKALLKEPEFLVLDEPTNHLDILMIEWLENYLADFCQKGGAVLLISHDRAFLEKVATKITALENKTLTTYEGGYGYYVKVRDARRAALETAFARQQEEIRRAEEYIRRFRAGIKAKQARGRQSQLNRLERIILPPQDAEFDYFAFSPPLPSAERVLELEEISFGYGGRAICRDLGLLVKKGEGVALVGANGVGKSTLLKIITGELKADKGRVKIGNRVKIGYFSQERRDLNPGFTVLDEIFRNFPFDEETSRRYLGAFLFRGDDVFKVVGDLSGGELSRLALLKLMLAGANFLILDEPTNHLDIAGKEAVEAALMTFSGTFLVVSHDRYFLNRISSRTLELADGRLTGYDGPYDYYRQKKAAQAALFDEKAAPPKNPAFSLVEEKLGGGKTPSAAAGKMPGFLASAASVPPKTATTPKAPQALSSPFKEGQDKVTAPKSPDDFGAAQPPEEQAAIKKTGKKPADEEKLARAEAEIAMCEAELKMLEKMISDPANQSDLAKSAALAAEYAAKQRELDEKYEKWGGMV